MSLDLSAFVPKRTTIILGGMNFRFAELTLADLAEFKAHLKEQRERLCEERRKRLIEMAKEIGDVDPMELLKLTDTSVSDEEMQEQMDTVEGVGLLAYYSLRQAHPGINKEQTMKLVTMDNLKDILAAMMPGMGSDFTPEKPIAAEAKKSTKRQQ